MILNPQLEKKALEEFISEIKKDLTEASFTIASEDVWGEKDMAYKINSSTTGYYLVYTLTTEDHNSVQVVPSVFNIKNDLWRYMFTSLES